MATHTLPTASAQPRRTRRWLWIGIAAVLAWLVIGRGIGFFFSATSDPGAPVSGVTEVAVRDDFFSPAAIEVPAGTTVTWTWEGQHPHNVVGDGFESPVQTAGTFARTFDDPGSHDYECTLHFGMRGRVVVTEASA